MTTPDDDSALLAPMGSDEPGVGRYEWTTLAMICAWVLGVWCGLIGGFVFSAFLKFWR